VLCCAVPLCLYNLKGGWVGDLVPGSKAGGCCRSALASILQRR